MVPMEEPLSVGVEAAEEEDTWGVSVKRYTILLKLSVYHEPLKRERIRAPPAPDPPTRRCRVLKHRA